MNLNTATRIGLNLLALLGAIAALRLGEAIFIPLVIALLLATILWSSANQLHRNHFPWPVACIGAVLALVVLNLFVTFGFALAVPKLIQDVAPTDAGKQQELYAAFRSRVQQISPVPLDPQYFPEQGVDSQFFKVIQETFTASFIGGAVVKLVGYMMNWFWQFILILFILLFLLMEGRMLTRRVIEIFGPSTEVRSKVSETMNEMTEAVRTYLVWRTIVNIGLGFVIGLIYYALGLKQSWLWALLTFVLLYIPYIGPIIAGIPPLLDAFVHVSPLSAVAVLIIYVVLITLEGYLIVPVVMGRHMDLNATTVMLACIFWELVWGAPGLFLAMPLMAAFKSVCDHVPGWKPWANLMSSRDDPLPVTREQIESARTIVLEDVSASSQTMSFREASPKKTYDNGAPTSESKPKSEDKAGPGTTPKT